MHRFFESIIRPALTILRPGVIVEIGIGEGESTQRLLQYCQDSGAILHSIDPVPQCDIDALQAAHEGRFIFHRDLSLHALPRIDGYDAILIDGDHNWYTVYHELCTIEAKAREQGRFPLVFLHDIGWPYGRRDLYYAPDTIPKNHRQPNEKKGVVRGEEILATGAGWCPHLHHATNEQTVHNGVLTAVEDFLAQAQETLHFVMLPGFHGLGILASATLLSQHSALQEFCTGLRLSPPLMQHMHALEQERLTYLLEMHHHERAQEDEKARIRHLEQELVQIRQCRERLRMELIGKTHDYQKHLSVKEAELQHMARTRSWRWTMPLRSGGVLLRKAFPLRRRPPYSPV